MPAHFGRHFYVTIVDFLSVSVRVRSLEVALGLVLQRISREPTRECGTSALWKSTAAQICGAILLVNMRDIEPRKEDDGFDGAFLSP